MGTYWRSRLFQKFFISYVFVLLVPFISGLLAYFTAYQIIADNSKEAIQAAVIRTIDSVDRSLNEADGFLQQISMNADLNLLMQQSYNNQPLDAYKVWRAWQHIIPYSLTNTILGDFYVYFHQSDILIHPSGPFVRPNDYFNLYTYKDMTVEQWREELLLPLQQRHISPSRALETYMGTDYHVIAYAQSLPLDSFRNPQATVVINIDEKLLHDSLREISEQYGGWAVVRNTQGEVMTWLGSVPDEASGEHPTYSAVQESILFEAQSDYNGWHYQSGIPANIVFAKANRIKQVTWIAFGLTLLTGLIISLLLSYRRIKPLEQMILLVREHIPMKPPGKMSEYEFLHGNIAHLLEHRNLLEKEYQQQKPLLQGTYLRWLLEGRIDSEAEMLANMRQVDLALPGTFGFVAVIRILANFSQPSSDMQERNMVPLIIEYLLEELASQPLHFVQSDSYHVAVLVACDKLTDPEQIIQQFEHTSEKLIIHAKRRYKIPLALAFGERFERLTDVQRSYHEAMEALDHAIVGVRNPVRYRDIPKESLTYYYPLDIEVRLMNAVKVGAAEETEELLEHLFEENGKVRNISPEMIRQFVSELKGTLFKLLDAKVFQDKPRLTAIRNEIASMETNTHTDMLYDQIRGWLLQLCRMAKEDRGTKQHLAHSQLMRFVQQHYGDSAMSLTMLADHLGLSEKAASQLFKDRMGEPFHQYIEQMRVKTATELLFRTELTIDEIAESTGYNSAHAFRRAFKRVTGVAPSEYRKTC